MMQFLEEFLPPGELPAGVPPPRSLATQSTAISKVIVVAPGTNFAEIAIALNKEHVAVGTAINAGLDHARRAGQLLIEAKARLSHGKWLPWLHANFAGSRRTAQVYIRIASKYSELAANAQQSAHLSQRDALDLLTEKQSVVPVPAEGHGEVSVVTTVRENIRVQDPKSALLPAVPPIPSLDISRTVPRTVPPPTAPKFSEDQYAAILVAALLELRTCPKNIAENMITRLGSLFISAVQFIPSVERDPILEDLANTLGLLKDTAPADPHAGITEMEVR